MGAVSGETELERLAARSRLLGADRSLILHGGGNTSTKLIEQDHLGVSRRVIRVKGSGSDLASARPADFIGLWLDELAPLREREAMSDEEMVAYVTRCMVDPGSARPSIETLLHAFLPAAHVDHVHADAICALANAPDPEAAVAAALGDDVAVVPYRRPGFALAKEVAAFADARAVVLVHHGLVTWGETHEASLGLTLELVAAARDYLGGGAAQPRAAAPDSSTLEHFLVALRGALSARRRTVLAVGLDEPAAERPDVTALAALRSTPDHMVHIGTASCVCALGDDPADLVAAFEAEQGGVYERQAGPDPPPRLDPAPRVVLVPGLGTIAAGPSAAVAGRRLEIAAHSHASVAVTLDRFGAASWLDEARQFEFAYWPLELYRLALAPPLPELAGTVAVVTGAASGIGRDVALELSARGAELVLADRDGPGLEQAAESLPGAVCVVGDLAQAETIDALVARAVASFGGVDAVVFNAGVASTGTLEQLTPEEWRRSLELNLTAHFLLTRRLWPLLRAQGLGASLVYVASKNAFAPGAGFGSYSVAKAGLVQLARIAALEGGAHRIRANVVNPDAIFGGSRLWSEELRRERAAAHGVEPEELEAFYASRSLLGRAVSGADVAEAVAFLVSDRSASTTGSVIPVDGGVAAAFPR